MRRWIVGFTALLVAIAVGVVGYGYYEYANTDWDSVPVSNASFMGTALSPAESEWRAPVLWGAVYKRLTRQDPAAAKDLGVLGQSPAALSLSLPEGTGWRAVLAGNDGVVLDVMRGDTAFAVPAGEYMLTITDVVPARPRAGYGSFVYRCSFSIEEPPKPALLTGKLALEQGDIVSLKLVYIPKGITPSAETPLGPVVFTPEDEGAWRAAIPISNAQSPGRYTIDVLAGDTGFAVDVFVRSFDFVEQNLIIDTSDPVISEANSPAAYQEYREKIPPLFETFDAERYWEGVFEIPAVGRVSTEFGTIRYTNGNRANPRRHNGMDIAAPEGTPVRAPNAGRVVMAERLLNTGNTIVIEHGGGLKSYFFHMSRLDVAPGEMVEKGALLGAIGSTGYSTGPHLHYETRIGNKPISPSMLFNADAGLYSVDFER